MRTPRGCPGCGHARHRHVGFQCYGPLQLIPVRVYGRDVLAQAVGGCSCSWGYWNRPDYFRGWMPPDGDPSAHRRSGHYIGKEKARRRSLGLPI